MTASYNAANEMSLYNGNAVSYDYNGNMTYDPVRGTTLTWDERNQLATRNGVTYAYDALGRRNSWTTTSSGGLSFIHDRANDTQTIGSGSFAQYSEIMLEGLDLDQYISIAQGGGSMQSVLHDGMG